MLDLLEYAQEHLDGACAMYDTSGDPYWIGQIHAWRNVIDQIEDHGVDNEG